MLRAIAPNHRRFPCGRALLGTALLLLASACPPPKPNCPNCTIKTASFTVAEYEELDQGYSIADVTMETEITTIDWCYEREGEPPCYYSDEQTLSITKPGDYQEMLPIETADNDDELVTIVVLLRADGMDDLTKEIVADVE